MVKVAFFDTKNYDKEVFDQHNTQYGFEITYFESKLSKETAPLTKGFDVVCIFVNDKADESTLKILQENGVKILALRCAGFNNVELEQKGTLKVVHVPQYSPYAVAEHAVALLLNLNRKLYKSYQRTRKYNFSLNGLLGFDIHGKTVGVIGTGRIGKVFIQIMKGFGANVIAYDTYQDKAFQEEMQFEYVDLDTLYTRSDIISLHCPLFKETEKMINKESIKKMKDKVILINCSRGKLINTNDLVEELSKGKIGGVGLDVYEDEEEFFLRDLSNSYVRDKNLSILLSMPNVIITSHQAFFTKEALDKIASDTLENIKKEIETGNCANEL